MSADRRPSSVAERVVAGFLTIALAVLAWIHFRVLPHEAAPEPEPFDLVNPMLDAKVGECVAIESETEPGVVTCVKVVEPGVVVRPNDAHQRLGLYGPLSRSLPYLVCRMRSPAPEKGCDDPDAREDWLLYGLDGFGMPLGEPVVLDSIKPLWVRRGGRYRFVYQVQLERYGRFIQGPVTLYVDPEESITGVVLRKEQSPRGMPADVVFTRQESCGGS